MTRIGWLWSFAGTFLLVASAASPLLAWPSWFHPTVSPYRLEVQKAARSMALWQGDHLVRRFRVVLGKQPNGSKQTRGDGRTPVGRYYIGDKWPSRRFHKFLALSYPNLADAERGLERQLIDQYVWADVLFAQLERTLPPQNTPLGGGVGIHGHGGRAELPVDWTEGCIAVSNEEIDFLYDTVPVGTPVDIRE